MKQSIESKMILKRARPTKQKPKFEVLLYSLTAHSSGIPRSTDVHTLSCHYSCMPARGDHCEMPSWRSARRETCMGAVHRTCARMRRPEAVVRQRAVPISKRRLRVGVGLRKGDLGVGLVLDRGCLIGLGEGVLGRGLWRERIGLRLRRLSSNGHVGVVWLRLRLRGCLVRCWYLVL